MRIRDFKDLLDINLIGTFSVIRQAAPLLAENPTSEGGIEFDYCYYYYNNCDFQML